MQVLGIIPAFGSRQACAALPQSLRAEGSSIVEPIAPASWHALGRWQLSVLGGSIYFAPTAMEGQLGKVANR